MSKLFVANWKRYLSIDESISLFSECAEMETGEFDLVIAPNHLALYACAHIDSPHALAAQDCFYETSGAYTGIISPIDVEELGCTYVILGHSERRTYQHESDETIAKKVSAAIAVGLTPILCVGETMEERDAGKAFDVIARQISTGLSKCSSRSGCIIAYEPRWAITGSGSGIAITPEDAREMHAYIKTETNSECAVLYGGSVTPDNIQSFISLDNCDGVLVGSASTQKDSLQRMLLI